MPIYVYRCPDCGHTQEHLQKMNEAPIATCPTCHGSHYAKQLTAAGFALKGDGWYATDYKPKPAPACGEGACEACQTSNTSA